MLAAQGPFSSAQSEQHVLCGEAHRIGIVLRHRLINSGMFDLRSRSVTGLEQLGGAVLAQYDIGLGRHFGGN